MYMILLPSLNLSLTLKGSDKMLYEILKVNKTKYSSDMFECLASMRLNTDMNISERERTGAFPMIFYSDGTDLLDWCIRGAAGVSSGHHGQEAAPRDLLERRQKSGPGKTENGNPAPDPEGIIINNNRRHKVPPCRRKKGRQRKKMWK